MVEGRWRSANDGKTRIDIKKSDAVCAVGLERNRSLRVSDSLLLPGQTIDSNFYCQQLERLRQAIERKWPELINRKDVVFHHDNARLHTSLVIRQKLRELGKFWCIHLIVLTLHHQTIICFDLHRILLMM